MNQPTREEFEALRAQVQRLERATEPIRITDTVLLQTLVTMAGTNAADNALLKGEMKGTRADISNIIATQSDHGEMLSEVLAWVKKQKGE